MTTMRWCDIGQLPGASFCINKQWMPSRPWIKLLDDPEISVRITAAEALYDMHEKSKACKA